MSDAIYKRNVPIYLLSSILTKIFGFGLLTYYARVLSLDEIGIISLCESFAQISLIIVSLYLDSAFVRYYYEERYAKLERQISFASTHFLFILFWGVSVTLITAMWIKKYDIGIPDSSGWTIFLIMITGLFNQLFFLLSSVWMANYKSKHVLISNIIFSLVGFITTILLISCMGFNWQGRIVALLSVSIVQLMLVIYVFKSFGWLRFRVDFGILKRSTKYSVPLIPNLAAGWISMFADRFILNYYGSLEQVGIYSVSAYLTLSLYMINDAFSKVNGPATLSNLVDDTETASIKLARYLHVFVPCMLIAYLLVSWLTPVVIIVFFDENFIQVTTVVLILGWTFVFSGIYRIFTNVISFKEKTWLISIGAIFQALINVILNFLFIPKFGILAAALSTSLSMLIYTVFLVFASQKLYKIKILKRLSVPFLIAFIYSVSSLYVEFTESHDLYFSISIGLICLVSLVIFAVLMYKTSELAYRI